MRKPEASDPEDAPGADLSRVLGAGSSSSQWAHSEESSRGNWGLCSSLIRPAPECPWLLSALAELGSDALSLWSPAIGSSRPGPAGSCLHLKTGWEAPGDIWEQGRAVVTDPLKRGYAGSHHPQPSFLHLLSNLHCNLVGTKGKVQLSVAPCSHRDMPPSPCHPWLPFLCL